MKNLLLIASLFLIAAYTSACAPSVQAAKSKYKKNPVNPTKVTHRQADCPDLTGDYEFKGKGFTTELSLSQEMSGGVTVFSLKTNSMNEEDARIVDGNLHEFRSQDPVDEGKTTEYRLSCDNQVLRDSTYVDSKLVSVTTLKLVGGDLVVNSAVADKDGKLKPGRQTIWKSRN